MLGTILLPSSEERHKSRSGLDSQPAPRRQTDGVAVATRDLCLDQRNGVALGLHAFLRRGTQTHLMQTLIWKS